MPGVPNSENIDQVVVAKPRKLLCKFDFMSKYWSCLVKNQDPNLDVIHNCSKYIVKL